MVVKFNSELLRLFSELDPNPIHATKFNGVGINGCVSGLYLQMMAVSLSWLPDVFCAERIEIRYAKAIYPTDIISLTFHNITTNNKRTTNFSFFRDSDLCCSGTIVQILNSKQ